MRCTLIDDLSRRPNCHLHHCAATPRLTHYATSQSTKTGCIRGETPTSLTRNDLLVVNVEELTVASKEIEAGPPSEKTKRIFSAPYMLLDGLTLPDVDGSRRALSQAIGSIMHKNKQFGGSGVGLPTIVSHVTREKLQVDEGESTNSCTGTFWVGHREGLMTKGVEGTVEEARPKGVEEPEGVGCGRTRLQPARSAKRKQELPVVKRDPVNTKSQIDPARVAKLRKELCSYSFHEDKHTKLQEEEVRGVCDLHSYRSWYLIFSARPSQRPPDTL